MTRPAAELPPLPGQGAAQVLTSVPSPLRAGMHLLIAVLLALTAARSVVDGAPNWPGILGCVVLVGVVYAVGPRWVTAAGSPRAAVTWLSLLFLAWLVLLALTPDAIYLAFPWFFLQLHLLPRPVGLGAVALTTVAAIGGFAWHQDQFAIAMAIGPILGAAVAIATVFGYQALLAESEQRRRLIVELNRARSDLDAAERRAGVLDERERLAREIHDTLAQGLSSIQLLLQAANRSLDPARAVDTDRAATLVEQARQTAKDNLAEARRFVRALAPADLDDSTLADALRRLCDTTAATGGIAVTFHQQGPAPELTASVEAALLRIAQGALGNAVQHSSATRADVTLTIMDDQVTLDVVDNGCGFDPAEPAVTSPDHRGFGIRSMRSRAAEIGGVLTIESRAGGGTAVSVQVNRSDRGHAR